MRERWRRWRRAPREPFPQAMTGGPVTVLFLAVTGWKIGLDALRSLATGEPTPAGATGLAAAAYGAVALAVAVPATYVAWAFARRPVRRD